MSHPEYKDKGTVFIRTSEECAELIKAICKAERFGLWDYHPGDPKKRKNIDCVLAEANDVMNCVLELRQQLQDAKKFIEQFGGSAQ